MLWMVEVTKLRSNCNQGWVNWPDLHLLCQHHSALMALMALLLLPSLGADHSIQMVCFCIELTFHPLSRSLFPWFYVNSTFDMLITSSRLLVFAVKYVRRCNNRRLIPTPGSLTDPYLNSSGFIAEDLQRSNETRFAHSEVFKSCEKSNIFKEIDWVVGSVGRTRMGKYCFRKSA